MTCADNLGSEVDLPLQRLEPYLRYRIPGLDAPMVWTRFTGGQSNPTYRADSGARQIVLRRKPYGPLLPSAHAIEREARVIAALAPTPVPVPEVLCVCEDTSVIGAAFYVMGYVAGDVHFDTRLPEMPAVMRAAVYDALIDTLAAIHGADVATLGLADYGRSGGYIARQTARWAKQYRATETGEIPAMERLIAALPEAVAAIPDETCLVHGDYRLDNVKFAAGSARPVAVLDWELSTLGHPLADLAYLLMVWDFPADLRWGLADADLHTLGIPTADALAARYAAKTGRDGIADLDLLVAYNAFRMAAIIQGVYRRGLDGNAADAAAVTMGADVPRLAEVALARAARVGIV
ncbi:MAG: phosphotransferase family protein [Pseudomonadota bacterium]